MWCTASPVEGIQGRLSRGSSPSSPELCSLKMPCRSARPLASEPEAFMWLWRSWTQSSQCAALWKLPRMGYRGIWARRNQNLRRQTGCGPPVFLTYPCMCTPMATRRSRRSLCQGGGGVEYSAHMITAESSCSVQEEAWRRKPNQRTSNFWQAGLLDGVCWWSGFIHSMWGWRIIRGGAIYFPRLGHSRHLLKFAAWGIALLRPPCFILHSERESAFLNDPEADSEQDLL